MTNIHQLPDPEQIEVQASEWIVRLQAEDLTEAERSRFAAWHAAHPRHARAYAELSATWRELRRAGSIVRAVSFGNAMNAVGDGIETPRSRPARHVNWAVAAAIVTVAVAVVFWAMQLGSQTLFQTAIGEHASIELPDGSRLDLNSNSLARVEYSDAARIIRLSRGEGFFKVNHDPKRAFWVVAGDSWIRAVGTAFNVDMRPSGVRVTVSEGVVKVVTERADDSAPSDDTLRDAAVSVLKAGQQAEVRGRVAKISSLEPQELMRLAAWRSGTLYFENQPLGSVIEELSRYTNAEVILDDNELQQLPIGGTFEANGEGVTALLKMLEEGFGLSIRRETAGQIYIEKKTSL